MSRLIAALVALASVLAFGPGLRAALDPVAPAIDTRIELVVVEAEGCIYCEIFRRDVLPSYRASARAARVPITFRDINDVEAGPFELASPIDNVPTVLIVKDNKEVGRISGYVGPDNFLHALHRLTNDSQ